MFSLQEEKEDILNKFSKAGALKLRLYVLYAKKRRQTRGIKPRGRGLFDR